MKNKYIIRKIEKKTMNDFWGEYKGLTVEVSRCGYRPRFYATVYNDKGVLVDGYCSDMVFSIDQAIEDALFCAGLISKKQLVWPEIQGESQWSN